ncbi:MAG: Exodeoxyribonuclease [Actinomycetota bacterium]
MTTHLDLRGELPRGRLVIEASAGTGKTYSLSALVVRHVAELDRPASSLLVVTFTKAAAAELRDRSRRALVDALEVLEAGVAPDGSWMEVLLQGDAADRAHRRRRVAQAIASFDDATISTIHGFCQQALRQLGVRSAATLDSSLGSSGKAVIDEVCRDLVVASLLDDASRFDWDSGTTPGKVLSELVESVTAVLANSGSSVVPTADDAPELAGWIELVHRAASEVGRRRRFRNEQGFDDLLTGLRDAIVDPVHGQAVVDALNERYHLVLVDEFQDTDPVQWEIFDRGFRGDMVLVGDPKQAIYRFRGADVHTYLSATDGQRTVHLATNYRSDRDTVAATNALLADVTLGDDRIVAMPVDAAPSARDRALQPGAPLVIRRVPRDPGDTDLVATGDARQIIVADLVDVVIDLLDHHRIEGAEGSKPVTPASIAVLVPTHSGADLVVRALLDAGVPAVRTRTGSVLSSPAGHEWTRLLAAIERPSSSSTVRAAGLGVFFGRTPQELDPNETGSDELIAGLQRQCAQWAADLAAMPLLAWYDRVRADSGVVTTLLNRRGGERDLTDLDHIAELMAAELHGSGTSAATLRRCLDRLRSGSGDADERDPQMRRIDSDADAVQVTTMHASKGLEYPIVLMPFSWQKASSFGPSVYHDDGTATRVVDIASNWSWRAGLETKDVRKHRTHIEQFGDQLRLLYVGLTRARHRTIVWWAPCKDVGQWALSTLLLDRDEAGEPRGSRPALVEATARGGAPTLKAVKASVPMDDDTADEALRSVADRSGGLIEVSVCPRVGSERRWSGPAVLEPPPVLTVADPGDRVVIDPNWKRWSFSSVSRTRQHTFGSVDDAAPVVGGADESSTATAIGGEALGQGPGLDAVWPEPGDHAVAMPLADVVGGRAFGNLVHAVLEGIDPTSVTLADDLAARVDDQLERDRLPVEPAQLVAGLSAMLASPLGPLFGGRRLADIGPTDRLAELAFDLPLAGTRHRVPARRIGEVLLDTLPGDDPQRPYADQLANGRFSVEIAGYLQGSIDAVLRVPGPVGAPRFVVVDYKTNRLHERGAARPLDSYHPDRLPAAMAHHDYPLQALLYSVALHRYLRWRLRGYDPAVHLGGIAYLFVRGMVGAKTPLADGRPYGVFAWEPPPATIVALDQVLALGGDA